MPTGPFICYIRLSHDLLLPCFECQNDLKIVALLNRHYSISIVLSLSGNRSPLTKLSAKTKYISTMNCTTKPKKPIVIPLEDISFLAIY